MKNATKVLAIIGGVALAFALLRAGTNARAMNIDYFEALQKELKYLLEP